MADTYETIADIIAEKRRQADEIERDVAEKMKRNKMISDRYARELVADIRQEADRLEAAIKRERGDCAKLREALKLCLRGMCGYCRMDAEARGMTTECVNGCKVMLDAKAALAEPIKNCEVGTAEEQSERFAEYCDSEVCKRNRCKFNAKALCIEQCALAWAQMPYKEGGAK